ncbi:hypothetical protein J7E62_09295 [Variovorax paradoxus]|nr:hypothetical protein [Variovorax paradoxus]
MTPRRSDDDYWEPSILGVCGSAHSVSDTREPLDDVVAKLHEVVKEVTGRAVEPPKKQRMGFLP